MRLEEVDVQGETQSQSPAATPPETETAVTAEQSIAPPEAEADDEGHTPNSKPREPELEVESYVYRDFSTIVAPPPQSLNPQSLQAQKLPSKLASMLSDPGKTCFLHEP